MKEAKLYRKIEKQKVQCLTCAHGCNIGPGKRGICCVMENQEGILYSLVYGKAVALHVDPIEKKPLFHFLPGSFSFSMATVGCNMHCLNCQNADISQLSGGKNRIEGRTALPEELVKAASVNKCSSISYTYTEPAIFLDYALDTAAIARKRGLKNVFVTNGYFSEQALGLIVPLIDAANVDLKTFDDSRYRHHCGARLEPVLNSIRMLHEGGVWIEVTTLLIPEFNDSEEELTSIAEFICRCGPDIPWHISRFHPTYRLTDRPPTSIEAIQMAVSIGKRAGLHHVYSGNVWGDEGENTDCYQCGTRLISRMGFQVLENRISQGKCLDCGTVIKGVW